MLLQEHKKKFRYYSFCFLMVHSLQKIGSIEGGGEGQKVKGYFHE